MTPRSLGRKRLVGKGIFFALLVACAPGSASGQCLLGAAVPCTWSSDTSALLRWQQKTDDGVFIELTKCKHPRCGVAVALSEWQQPSDTETTVTLLYKIYGYSSVYLSVHIVSSDSQQSKPLKTVYGNYADSFPTTWSSTTFTIPPTTSRYRLALRGNIPYKNAYIAVKGISLAGRAPLTTTSSTSTTPRPEPNEGPDDTANEFDAEDVDADNEDNEVDVDDNDQVDVESGGSEDEGIDENRDLFYELELAEAAEFGRFYAEDELNVGRTTTVYPNLCKYR